MSEVLDLSKMDLEDHSSSLLGKPRSTIIDISRQVFKAVTVRIPEHLTQFMREVAHKTNDEYSILIKGYYEPETCEFVLDVAHDLSNIYIPSQVCSPAHLSITESGFDRSFNVVIHRHPEGVLNFSSTDDNSINREFELSLLYVPSHGFVKGVYNFNFENVNQPMFQVPCQIVNEYQAFFGAKVNEILSKMSKPALPVTQLGIGYPRPLPQRGNANPGLRRPVSKVNDLTQLDDDRIDNDWFRQVGNVNTGVLDLSYLDGDDDEPLPSFMGGRSK